MGACLRTNACEKRTKMGRSSCPTVQSWGTLSTYNNRDHAHANIHVLPNVRKVIVLHRALWRRSSRMYGYPAVEGEVATR